MVTATVLVGRFAASACPSVTPLAICTVQAVSAARSAVLACSTRVAVLVPDCVIEVSNVVVPHPLVVGVLRDASPNVGSTRVMLSSIAMLCFATNAYERLFGPIAAGSNDKVLVERPSMLGEESINP